MTEAGRKSSRKVKLEKTMLRVPSFRFTCEVFQEEVNIPQQEQAVQTLKAVRYVSEELGLHTVLGVSNISFGLPARENITVSFKVGDSVEVTGGSFEGFIGKVEKIDLDAQTADVLVSMFGRETSVTLPLTQVKPEA